jgi:hypothetical protein
MNHVEDSLNVDICGRRRESGQGVRSLILRTRMGILKRGYDDEEKNIVG